MLKCCKDFSRFLNWILRSGVSDIGFSSEVGENDDSITSLSPSKILNLQDLKSFLPRLFQDLTRSYKINKLLSPGFAQGAAWLSTATFIEWRSYKRKDLYTRAWGCLARFQDLAWRVCDKRSVILLFCPKNIKMCRVVWSQRSFRWKVKNDVTTEKLARCAECSKSLSDTRLNPQSSSDSKRGGREDIFGGIAPVLE